MTLEQVFRALAKQVPVDGKLVDNPNRTWKDVDPSLPDRRIEVLGPPPTSGTRDAFVEVAMEGGARQIPMLAALRARTRIASSRSRMRFARTARTSRRARTTI